MMLTGYLNSFHLPVRYHVAINQRIPKLLEEVITPSLLFSLHSLVGLQAMDAGNYTPCYLHYH